MTYTKEEHDLNLKLLNEVQGTQESLTAQDFIDKAEEPPFLFSQEFKCLNCGKERNIKEKDHITLLLCGCGYEMKEVRK